MAYFKVSQHSSGETEKNYKTPQVRQLATWPRFNPGISRIQA